MEDKNIEDEILFVGDLFYDFDFIPDDIETLADWIQKNNLITVLNLESPIGKGKGAATKKRGPNLASSSMVVEVLKKLNVAGVCLANNHMMDYGKKALADTIFLLDENGIAHTGAGQNLDEALNPISICVNNKTISILNFGWDVEETIYAGGTAGCAPRDMEIVLSAIQNAKGKSDLVSVCFHWGFEYNRLPMPYDIDLAHRVIDAGADLIIGHHPHCVQPKEIYKGKTIYYSLGNFYFSSRRSRYTKKFDELVPNQSDYGCMVSYNVGTGSCEEHLICYDHDKDYSSIKQVDSSILEDISGVNFNSETYIREAWKRKLNINPILGCDVRENYKQLTKLYRTYKIKAMLKFLLHRR